MNELLILLYFIELILGFQGDIVLKELGEKEYRILEAKSNLPMHGECWHKAIKAIKNSCDKLNDQEHSLLALQLANCFLDDSGHVTYDCYLEKFDEARRKCINAMSDRAFGVYNEFYTHTTHICFYLNHELWQTETEKTIRNLYFASSKMTEQLIEASQVQGSMLESQKEGLKIQNQLLAHGEQLGTVIKSSAETVNSMVTDFKETSRHQQALLYEIFSYMRAFQDWIIGEVSWFQSIVYYIVACVLSALFSSSKRTCDVRITLFTILSLNVILERMLVQYNLNSTTPEDEIELIYYTWSTEKNLKKADNDTYERIRKQKRPRKNLLSVGIRGIQIPHFYTWCLRKIALSSCCAILIYSYYSYRDEHLENNQVLRRIEKQLHSLKEPPQPFKYRTRLAVKRLNNSHTNVLGQAPKSLQVSQ